MTSQGHARTAFRRALERGNLVVAELEARDVGRLDLREALELTALVAKHDRSRAERYAARWLRRYLDEQDADTRNVALAAATLEALGGPQHAEALALLHALTAA